MPAKSTRKPKQTTAAAADLANGTEPAHGAEPIEQDAPGDQATEGQATEDQATEPEVPLNRAERRARKKGNPKAETSGAFRVGGRQSVRHDNPVHTRRQWATRRSG